MSSMRLYNLARWVVNLGDFSTIIAPALRAGPSDRTLEVGCGTGANARDIRGLYVGLDPDEQRIRYAARTLGSKRRHFLAGTLAQWRGLLQPGSFTRGLIVNVLHHVDDATARRILGELAGLTAGRLVLIDAAPERSNLLQSTLLALDPGKHMRTADQLAALVEPCFQVEHIRGARTRSASLELNVLTATPRPS